MADWTLRRLRYFTTLVDEGHFGRAAAALHISQPALSAEIRKLEHDLGLQLFVRSRRGTRPTDAGLWLHRRAGMLLESATRLTHEAREVAAGAVGHVIVGFVQTLAHRGLPDAVTALSTSHPGIRVELVEMSTGDQLDALQRGQIDIACGHAPSLDPEDDSRRLFSEPFLACLPRDHRLGSEPLALSQLAHEPFVVFRQDVSPHYFERVRAMCFGAGFQPRIAHRTATWQTVGQLVGAGLGVALMPAGMIPDNERIRLTALTDGDYTSEVWVVTRREVRDATVQVVLDLVLSRLGG
jgi:DNA-binding transcriptional LysR family regulator